MAGQVLDDFSGPPQKKHAGETDHLAEFLQDVLQDEKVSDQLTKLRSGPPAARKQAMRNLSQSKDCRDVIDATLPMLREPNIDSAERLRLIKLLCRLLQRQPSLGQASPVAPLAFSLLSEAKKLIASNDRSVQTEEGIPLLSNVARVIGLKSFLMALRPSFDSTDEPTRRSNAICIAASTHTFGVPLVLPLIRALVNDGTHTIKQLGLAIIQQLPRQIGNATLPFLRDLVDCASESLKEPQLSSSANSALSHLAEAVSPFGIEAFEPVKDALWAGARRRRGKPKIAFLRTLASLAPLTDPAVVHELAAPVLEMASKIIESPQGSKVGSDVDDRRSALSVARMCVKFLGEEALKGFLGLLYAEFWTPEAASDGRTASLAVWTAVEIPVSRSSLIEHLVSSNALVSDFVQLQNMGVELLARLPVKQLVLQNRTEERLMDGLLVALPDSAVPEGSGDALVDLDSKAAQEHASSAPSALPMAMSVRAVRNVFEALPPDRVAMHAQTWIEVLLKRDASPSPIVRESSLRMLAAITPLLPSSRLLLILRRLVEELGEEYPEVLSEVITALHSVVDVMGSTIENSSPSSSEILPRLTPILRNRNEKVQESCITLIRAISEIAGDSVSAREWMQICFELLELQKSQRQRVRYEATAAFASISTTIGPADVVATLLSHLKSPDRQFRVTTAAAIASVAVETGPFTVLPILINEYSSGDITMQHGVLKTLDFLFQFLEPGKGLPYVKSLVTLIDDALVDTNQVHRQTAASIVGNMARGSIGAGLEDVFVHFLNELMPSIFETSPHVINRVLEAIDSIRVVIGTPAFTNYIWAGLYHPARKVRTVYWNMWNSMYIQDADAIVCANPAKVPDPTDSGADIRDVFFG